MDVRNYRKGKPDKKKGRDAVFRTIGFFAAGVAQSLFTDHPWWTGTILSFGLFVMFFDYIMAWGMSKRLDYLGKTAWTDRLIGWMAWPYILFIRGWVFAVALTFYYDLHKVLYGNF